MKKLLLVISLLQFLTAANAQEKEENTFHCASSKKWSAQQKITVADTAEDNYDMKFVHLDLNVTSINDSIYGNALIASKVVSDSLKKYVFELSTYYTIDSCKINGQLLTATDTGIIRTIVLPTALMQGNNLLAHIFYHGRVPNSGGFFAYGIRNQTSPTWGTHVTYTMSESYESRDWWPTKQSLTDKIDSSIVWLTVPDTCKGGSNGTLYAVDTLSGNRLQFKWKEKHPIDYYLISLAVAPYVDYSFYIHFPLSTDSMLYQNYVYTNPNTLPYFKTKIDSCALTLLFYSKLFGKYPFWKEKYGHCMAPLNGGMEHQTMTTLGNFGLTLSAHELLHQWFGDYVTCGTWKDIWLNEGFASYGEYLFIDRFQGAGNAATKMYNVHEHVISSMGGSVYVDDTTTENRIFDSRLTYDKGSAVIHSLRFLFNNDTTFLLALRTYLQTYAFKTATTANFQQVMESNIGYNLDTFFQQWIYKEGFPIYGAKWNQIGDTIYVALTQQTSMPSSQTLFTTPLELKFKDNNGDSLLVKVYNNANTQNFTFHWAKTVSNISIDPNDWLIDSNSSITYDPTLAVNDVPHSQINITPNPTHDSWNITGLNEAFTIQLMDVTGKLMLEKSASGNTTIPAGNLPQGIYVLKLSTNKKTIAYKLIKE